MGDDRPDEHRAPDMNRPKRPPPTIDLAATEIPRGDGPDGAATAEAPGETTAGTVPPRRGAPVAAAACAGAMAGALVAGLAWYAGSTWMPPAPPPEPQTAAAPQVSAAKVDDLAARLTRLESRPAPAAPAPAPPPTDLAPVMERLDALDKSAAALRDETAALRAQSTQALAAASEAQKEAQQAPPPAVPDLTAITTRLSQLETAARTQNDRLAEQARKPADEMATRRIAAAALLDSQVRAGEPFAAALAAARTLAPDAAALRALEPYAAAGVPSANALSRALLDLPQFAPPPSTATSGGLIDRLKTGATKLVKIERIDSPNADNAVFARAAAAARRDDIAAAARELAALPASERATVQPWLDQVAAREAARAASRQFANDSLAALPKPQAAP